MNQDSTNQRLGVTAALAAFGFWGLAPIYFKWIASVTPLEIIVHRILWSIPVLAGFLLLRDGPGFWRRMRLPPRAIGTLCFSGLLIVTNWLLFVWAVNDGQILATSLGYFITPLVNVLLGVIFLHERLNAIQITAVAIASAATIFLTWYVGVAPWVSLFLAATFGLYGLVRKKLNVGPMLGLMWEALLLAIPAVVYLLWLMGHNGVAFGHASWRLDVLLVLLGFVTVVPLIWFNVAARNLALSFVGFFQYLAPTITFLLAVFVYGETFTPGHAVAFTLIWIALALVSIDSLSRIKRASLR